MDARLLDLCEQDGALADVAVLGKRAALGDVDLLALRCHEQRALAAGQASTHDEDPLPHLGAIEVDVVNLQHLRTVGNGHGRLHGFAAHRDDDRIGVDCLDICLANLRIKADLDALAFTQARIGHAKLVHVVLEGNRPLGAQDAAELAFGLAQNRLMASLLGSDRRHHASNTTADDEHALAAVLRHGDDLVAFELAADERIHRATTRLGHRALRHAHIAAQALDDLVALVRHHLVGEHVVGKQGAAHVDEVSLTGGDDLFHLSGVAQAAERGDGFGDVLLDLCRKIDVAAVLAEHARVGDAKAKLVAAGGDVDEVAVVLERLGDAHAFVEVVAAVEELAAAHADLDREVLAALLANGDKHLASKARAVLKAAAVLVGAFVEVRAQKLVDQPAVAAVQHAHLKASALGKRRSLGIGSDDIVDLLLGEGLDLHAVGTHAVAGSVLAQIALAVLVDHVGAGILTGV